MTFISDQTVAFRASPSPLYLRLCRYILVSEGLSWPDHQMGCKDFSNPCCSHVCLCAFGAVYWRWWKPPGPVSVYARIVPFGIWQRLMVSAVKRVRARCTWLSPPPVQSILYWPITQPLWLWSMVQHERICAVLVQNVWMPLISRQTLSQFLVYCSTVLLRVLG